VSSLRRPRRTFPAALAAVFLVYLVAGHASHPGQTMEEAAMGAGICILLVTVVGAVAFAAPLPALAWMRPAVLVAPLAAPSAAPVARARASPAWLQRFLD
jgi:hypothetical protein